LKTIETRQQRQLYTETGSSEAYFIWLMDLFLEEFSDFGTNPIRSIRYSLTVILIFAAIYFLAPVAIDERPKRNLYSQLSLYASFINHNRPFEDLYREHLALFQAAEAPDTHRVALRREVQQLPWALRILIPRQVGVRTLFTTLEARFYQLIDQKGDLTWDELSKRKKWTLGLVFWLVAGASIGYFLVLRVIDSVVLSLNVFSTLGFGEIRVRGVAVYLTILEGFLGWFLLSIFSVVLLNQLLQ
ncbi:MAG: potassium channel family protein, partial [Bacteroidia bacterium]|nr:potassium channel family protein [Bacteroidia bacterium]